MRNGERRLAYASLWVLALAFGWIEASVVVYLREIHAREMSLHGTNFFAGLQVTLVSLPNHLVALEMAREAWTIVLLGAVAWLAGRRPAERAGAFLLAFGAWDLTYYAVLKFVAGWPDSIRAWDILFLIPLPWVAPVWAPISVATLFVIAGTYLFSTADHERRYQWADGGVLAASAFLTIAAFLAESSAAVDHRTPERFASWLFWAGVVLGTVWFARVERRGAGKGAMRSSWGQVRVRTSLPEPSKTERTPSGEPTRGGSEPSEFEEADVSRLSLQYEDARLRLDALLDDAREVAERFEKLAHGLSAHPQRMIIGLPDRFIEEPSEWDVVSSHPLPGIERLTTLTNDIREATLKVDQIRERLILMGRADVVEQPDGFFH